MSVNRDVDPPPGKRPRTEDPDSDSDAGTTEPQTELKKHETLWFDDGNVILVASRILAFKVYRGVLSRCSGVFRDLLSVKLEGEPMEGCRVVHLPDNPSELGYLLSALFLRSSFIVTQCGFEELAAILRLSTKYSIPGLRQESLEFLNYCFPANATMHEFTSLKRRNLLKAPGAAIGLVNLALELKLDAPIGNLALYECCTMPIRDLCDGYKRSDGTTETLDSKTMGRCMRGRDILVSTDFRRANQWMNVTRPTVLCTPATCPGLNISVVRRSPKAQSLFQSGHHAPQERTAYMDILQPYCRVCMSILMNERGAGRQTMLSRVVQGAVFPKTW
ncbi:hypothetical protein JAAARDRAFT_46492 [Jaapia argillacea MUCL 33604]|uniref:BTB domain-containing protein n=1 Tax=Jaapia argillacea MUCL 33604 TaxID=933084 RepID=A0A067Q8X0_9AGAM|nr:hypothetical protein JAAARDRAFT_46492 [Jaapia argillacea MUCL 33604]